MKKIPVLVAVGLLATALGCKKASDDEASNDKFDRIMARLDAMDKKIDQIGQGRGARPQAPSEPDPKMVYSVPVSDADFPKGPATAKVTIVEAADFA